MVVSIQKNRYITGRLTADCLMNRYNIRCFFKVGNKYIALQCNEREIEHITHVNISERVKEKPYKQCMDMSMGKIPKQYRVERRTYAVQWINEHQIPHYKYEVYEVI